MTLMTTSLKRLLGDHILGIIDFYRHPERKNAWGGPFNGQRSRQELFQEVLHTVHPCAIIETGTYLGTTTEILARCGLPVFTIEGHPRNCGYARARLRSAKNVTVLQGDSRIQLKRLLRGPLRDVTNKVLFFYLDAHWSDDLPLLDGRSSDDLPLAEELEIIFGLVSPAVVMIDDFQVPEDLGYRFDDYGRGKTLNAPYIAPIVTNHGLEIFYPSTPAVEETGAQRGCAVLSKTPWNTQRLRSVRLLRSS
jgi:hypothetical protein